MKEKKRSNTNSREQKKKATQNLSAYLPMAWLRFLDKNGFKGVFNPYFKIESFISFVRADILHKKIVNDMGEEGLKFFGNPFGI